MDIRAFIRSAYKKVIGWGTGGYFDKYIGDIPVEISYLIDSNETKWGRQKNGLDIKPPETLMEEDPSQTLVIVFSSFYTEIIETVKGFGDFDVITGYQFTRLAWINNGKPLLNAGELETPVVATISRNNFSEFIGGTSKFIREQMKLIRQRGKNHFHFFWNRFDIKHYRCNMISVVKNGQLIGIYFFDEILPVLKKAEKLIIHNLIGLDTEVLDSMLDALPSESEVIYYLHDYSSICKNIKLMHNNTDYCEAFNKEWRPCLTCMYNEDQQRIYEYHANLFRSRKKIRLIAPSVNVKKNFIAAFRLGEERIRVIPHQIFDTAVMKKETAREKIRVAYVGYKHPHKGWDVFKQTVERYKDKYDFYCMGYSDEILDHVRHIDVSFIDDGPLAMVKKLKEHDVDIALLWSVWPETYSYTYYESGAAGAFVVTHERSGNISEQTRIHKNGVVLKDVAELFELLDDEPMLRRMLSRPRPVFQNLRINDAELTDAIS